MPSVGENEPVRLSPNQVKTVAVIGGGASGAIISDSLLKDIESGIVKVTLFERRPKLGGVWVLDEKTIETPNNIIISGALSASTDPQLENPFHGSSEKELVLPKTKQERFLQSPSYAGLSTNVVERMMTFSDKNSWDLPGNPTPEESRYVGGLVVRDYIDEYISRNLPDPKYELVRNATIEDVERIHKDVEADDELPYKFKLTIRQPQGETDLWTQREFDSIVVSTGHYHVPFITDVPGLKEIQKKHDGVVQHAKFFRSPLGYAGKKVIVVGSRASGADLAKLIARTGAEVYQSIRSAARRENINLKIKPVITEYKLTELGFTVVFEDGTEIENPDHVIYGTGYDWSYPFLNRLTNSTITADGKIVPDLYQHTFYINDPLISFVGVPVDGISFRVFEYQALLVARFLTGRISLPTKTEQKNWAAERLAVKGYTRAYHTIGLVDAVGYLEKLVELGKLDESKYTGRKFPVLTDEDLEALKEGGLYLAKFWDEI